MGFLSLTDHSLLQIPPLEVLAFACRKVTKQSDLAATTTLSIVSRHKRRSNLFAEIASLRSPVFIGRQLHALTSYSPL